MFELTINRYIKKYKLVVSDNKHIQEPFLSALDPAGPEQRADQYLSEAMLSNYRYEEVKK